MFLTPNNILNVLRQSALLFLMASGLTLVILTAGLDLSIGANVGAVGLPCGERDQARPARRCSALPTGIGCGALIGLANGILVTALRIPSFIATYGMMWMLTGVTYYYMAGETIHGFPAVVSPARQRLSVRRADAGLRHGAVPADRRLFAQRTIWGQQIYAIGANPVAARLSGVPVERRLVLVYAMSGAMAGLASLIILARINSAQGDIGEDLTLPAVAAVLVGGTSLFGGSGTVAGTLIGALILTLVLNGMNLLQINSSWQPLVTGVIVLLAVWIDTRTRRIGE